jgi:uncharacterized protein (DUF697 family)/uncharacterized tellurite resistance protein B-like protein
MTDAERNAVLAIAIHAAFADGAPADPEREQIRKVADALAPDAVSGLPSAYQAVLVERHPVEEAVGVLRTPEVRRFAYEMAVTVAEADGVRSDAERAFLDRLRSLLGVDAAPAAELERQTRDILATTPVAAPPPGARAGGPAASPVTPDAAALDAKILNYAILNGALELLPESVATMAIIPLQMKLVYEVGQAHGYELDRGHVTELLATVGIGLTSQAVEQVGRKILGGILGSIGGGLFGGLGRQAASSGVAFATTYALGQVAREYYASGRRIDGAQLRKVFDRMLEEAKGLAGRYSGQVAEKARTIDTSRIAALVKGGP